MKKKTIKPQDDDMLPEYDLTGIKGARGKYAKSLKKGYSIRVLKADGTVDEFDILVKQARKQAKATKLKKRDIKSAIAKVRKGK
jgi:hypothetical protein